MEQSLERAVVKQNINIVILHLIAEKERHGWSIMSELRRRYGTLVSSSVIYPTLYNLTQNALVTCKWDNEDKTRKAKKVYRITAKGRKILSVYAHDLGSLAAELNNGSNEELT